MKILTALFVIAVVATLLAIGAQVKACFAAGGEPLVGLFNTVCVDKAVVK